MIQTEPDDKDDLSAAERFYTAVIIIVLLWLLASATVLFVIHPVPRSGQGSALTEVLP